jgi:hypothetical protein
MQINLYPDRKALNDAEVKMGHKADVTGYVQKYNTLYAYNDAGIGTLSHEVMHKIGYENFKNYEQWAFLKKSMDIKHRQEQFSISDIRTRGA